MRIPLAAAAACLALACATNLDRASGESAADLVFLSGAIYAVDASRPWAEAIALRNGRITAVGGNADVRPHIGDRTRVVDLDGRMLLPGFHDAHLHPGRALHLRTSGIL